MSNDQNNKPRILVVEDEAEIRELIVFFLEYEMRLKTLEAENGAKAKEILDANPQIQIIVSDYTMPVMNGGALLQYVRSLNRPIKYVLLSAVNPESIPEFKFVKPDAVAPKPMFMEQLRIAVQKFMYELEKPEKTDQFVRFALNQLSTLGTIQHPLFAKLSENKFIKVVNENEFLGNEEIERFKKKNITHLYMELESGKKTFKTLMDHYTQIYINNKMPSNPNILMSDKISHAIQDLAFNFGFSEDLQQITKAGVDQALKTMASEPSLKKLLDNLDLKNGNYLAVHSSRLPYIANHLAKLMKWDTESNSYKMALASFLHDSTLQDPKFAHFEIESELEVASVDLSVKDLENLIHHPKNASDLAAQFTGIPADVAIIIAQHHEKCDGTGFPNKINHLRIAPLSCLFIVAHDLINFYEKTGSLFKMEDFISKFEPIYKEGHFKKILLEMTLYKMI